jgi:AGCS family alanine or glycine:cation symporter
MYGVFEVFMDTIVICTLTAMAILISGCAPEFYGQSAGTDLTIMAFGTTFGNRIASTVIALCITMFAYSTLLSWALYGGRCFEFLFGRKGMKVYYVIYVAFVILGANVKLGLVWTIADAMNALMAVPNLIAVLSLSPVVYTVTKKYFAS